MAIFNSASTGADFAAASQAAISQFKQIDDYRRQRTTETLNRYLPQFSSIIGQATADFSSYLSSALPQLTREEIQTYNQLKQIGGGLAAGQLPAETIGSVRRASAIRPGMGQISTNMTARDIGLTSVQLQQQGAAMLKQASDVAMGITQAQASATNQLSQYAQVGQTITDMFGMKPELLAQLQSQIDTNATQRYTAQLQAQTEAARLAEAARENAAALAQQQYEFRAAVSQSGVNQQLGILQGVQGVRSLATSNPLYTDFANQYISSAAMQNQSIANWTNKLLSGNMRTPNFSLGY